jgi:hypothetical protein
MRRTLRDRRLDRKHPAPPPTPEGFVYAKRPYSGLVLVKADELHEFAKADMDLFDNLPPELRKEYRERATNIPVNPEDMERAEQNRELAAFGIGRAG